MLLPFASLRSLYSRGVSSRSALVAPCRAAIYKDEKGSLILLDGTVNAR